MRQWPDNVLVVQPEYDEAAVRAGPSGSPVLPLYLAAINALAAKRADRPDYDVREGVRLLRGTKEFHYE